MRLKAGKTLWAVLVAIFIIFGVSASFVITHYTDQLPESNWKTYRDNNFHYSFRYPSTLIPATTPDFYVDDNDRFFLNFPDVLTDPSESGVSIDLPSSVSFGASTSTASTCYQIDGIENASNGQKPSTVEINGHSFDFLHSGSCGAGDCDDVYQYSIFAAGICYRADLILVVGPPAYSTKTPSRMEVELDNRKEQEVEANLKMLFQKMLSTWEFR